MKVDVINIDGKSTGKQVELPAGIFEAEPNEHVLYLAVKQYLAHQRQGTHKAKERAEIKGSTRKIKRQKGTGTARFGDIKNPLFKGGGRIFGPRPRKYKVKLNAKVSRLARISAFSAKAKEGKVKVVEDFTLDNPSTKTFAGIIGNISPDARRTLLLTAEKDQNLLLSSRNLTGSDISEARNANAYQIMHASEILVAESAVEKINEILAK